jgi:hypothetical protein
MLGVFGFEYVADPLDPDSRSRTVCVGIHKDEAEDFQLLMQSKLPGVSFGISYFRSVSSYEMPVSAQQGQPDDREA